MKPAVLRPRLRSSLRCSSGKRTNAWRPDKKTRPCSSKYLSSSVMRSGGLPFITASACDQLASHMGCRRLGCPELGGSAGKNRTQPIVDPLEANPYGLLYGDAAAGNGCGFLERTNDSASVDDEVRCEEN